MGEKLKYWWQYVWRKKAWLIFLFFYKFFEDWGLGKLTEYAENNRGALVSFSPYLIEYLPWATWIAIPIVIIILIVKTWRDSAKTKEEIIPVVETIRDGIEQQQTFDVEDITKKIFITYNGFSSEIGNIVRSVIFVFDVKNASSVWIQPTGSVQGNLIFEASRLMGIHWQVQWQKEIEPDGATRLAVISPVNERLAESLAFKPIDGSFSAEFSEMKVEFEARDANHQRQSLGYIPLGNRYDIPIRDEIALQKIRKVVKWSDSLDDDERIR